MDRDDTSRRSDRNRGQVQLPDAINGLIVLVGIAALGPVWFRFADMIATSAGPFTTLVLQASLPFMVILLVLSIGVSARRGGFR